MRALELGCIPSRPVYDTRYDLIIDDSKKLKRIQVKYADGRPSRSKGSVVVKLAYEDRRKKIYTSMKHAKKVIRRKKKKGIILDGYNIYKCKYCGFYHLGHKKD